jgi:hypothetical protein
MCVNLYVCFACCQGCLTVCVDAGLTLSPCARAWYALVAFTCADVLCIAAQAAPASWPCTWSC